MKAGQLASWHGGRRRQRGAAAIEFALVFVLFFIILYGAIAYGIVFAVEHSLNFAASEGARAAVQDVPGGLEGRIDRAATRAKESLTWLGARAPEPDVTSGPCSGAPSYTCVTVKLTYDYAQNPIVPPLPALGFTLPATLTSQATVELDAVS